MKQFIYKYSRLLFFILIIGSFFIYNTIPRSEQSKNLVMQVEENGKVITVSLTQKELEDIVNNRRSTNDRGISEVINNKKISQLDEVLPAEDTVTQTFISMTEQTESALPKDIGLVETEIILVEEEEEEEEEEESNSNMEDEPQTSLLINHNKVISIDNYQVGATKKSPNRNPINKTKIFPKKPKKEKKVKKKKEEKAWPIALEPSDAQILKDINYTKYKDEDREFLEGYLPEMLRRARRLGRTCSDHVDLMRFIRESPLVWDQKHNLVWCVNYKVASTSWMTNFLRLAHFNEDNEEIRKLPPKAQDRFRYTFRYGARHPVLFKIYPEPEDVDQRVKLFKESIRFLIVRHPFSRILSSYRDKMLKMNPLPRRFGFRDLQKRIIATYRPKENTENSPYPTFSEFINHVIDSTKDLVTPKDWNQNVKCWTPFWAQCNVCASDFNLVMKLESMPDDERFIETLADLKEVREHKGNVWRHLNNASSSDLAMKYYGQLTQQQITKLYSRYKLDFDLFNYDIGDYLENAIDAGVVGKDDGA